jgi:hypothetical protein
MGSRSHLNLMDIHTAWTESRALLGKSEIAVQETRGLSGIDTIENFTGFGLYARREVDLVKQFDDLYPYFRGMIAPIGLSRYEIPDRRLPPKFNDALLARKARQIIKRGTPVLWEFFE